MPPFSLLICRHFRRLLMPLPDAYASATLPIRRHTPERHWFTPCCLVSFSFC